VTEFVTDGHLGGYIRGGDPATFYPDLWKWIVESEGIRSVLDVGCGEGIALDFFAELGCDVLGIEGMPQEHKAILRHDYTAGRCPMGETGVPGWGMVWSCEFVEHIEERYIDNFLIDFARAPLVLMTHAGPGQPGYHHVNCQGTEYWIGVMAANGFRYDDQLTRVTRALADINTDPNNHYARSGLAFRKY
jgi:SAM-dependent methyltransferase